jgi:hypothetical protein
MTTKMLFTALGLATLVATPAFAEKPTQAQRTYSNSYNGAYASAGQPGPLVYGGRVIGTDPDPSIRFELDRDSPTYTSGN